MWESGESLANNIKWNGWRIPRGNQNCEPNNACNQNNLEEDCASTCLFHYGWKYNRVCDIRCGDKRPYMCQRPISRRRRPEYVATIDGRGWKWKVYYSHVRMMYHEAEQECGKINATLVGDEDAVDALVSFAALISQKLL